MQLFGNAAPEFFRMLDRFAIDAVVFLPALDVGPLAKLLRRLKSPLLLQRGIDVHLNVCRGSLVCHPRILVCAESVGECVPRRFYMSKNLCRYLSSGSR